MHHMSCQDGIAYMQEVTDLGLICDLYARMPHVRAAQDTAEGHHNNEVASQGRHTSTAVCHHPS